MYKLGRDGNTVIRLSDGCIIPKDPTNREFRRYLQWLAVPNEPEPAWTPEELAAKQAEDDAAAAKAAKVAEAKAEWLNDNISSMDPTAIRTYIDNNVTDLPSAKEVLKRLAVAVWASHKLLAGGE